jgi:hypothetical protein
VLTVLLGCLALAALVGLSTGSGAAWWVVIALSPLVSGYLALLAWARRVSAEREFNLAFFAGTVGAAPSFEALFETQARVPAYLPSGALTTGGGSSARHDPQRLRAQAG